MQRRIFLDRRSLAGHAFGQGSHGGAWVAQLCCRHRHPLATQAALQAYDKGGNAVDAAVAAALTLGVVDGHNSGIGGGCFFATFAPLTARRPASTAAKRPPPPPLGTCMSSGTLDQEASKPGALAVAVPGALRAYERALQKFGRLKLADLLLPAAQIAEQGFPIDEVYARKLAATAAKLQRFAASAAIFLHSDGSPLKKGERLVQKDLATTYRAVAKQGTAWFYEGQYAAGRGMDACQRRPRHRCRHGPLQGSRARTGTRALSRL